MTVRLRVRYFTHCIAPVQLHLFWFRRCILSLTSYCRLVIYSADNFEAVIPDLLPRDHSPCYPLFSVHYKIGKIGAYRIVNQWSYKPTHSWYQCSYVTVTQPDMTRSNYCDKKRGEKWGHARKFKSRTQGQALMYRLCKMRFISFSWNLSCLPSPKTVDHLHKCMHN